MLVRQQSGQAIMSNSKTELEMAWRCESTNYMINLPVGFAACLRYPFMKAQTQELQKSWGPLAHHVARQPIITIWGPFRAGGEGHHLGASKVACGTGNHHLIGWFQGVPSSIWMHLVSLGNALWPFNIVFQIRGENGHVAILPRWLHWSTHWLCSTMYFWRCACFRCCSPYIDCRRFHWLHWLKPGWWVLEQSLFLGWFDRSFWNGIWFITPIN